MLITLRSYSKMWIVAGALFLQCILQYALAPITVSASYTPPVLAQHVSGKITPKVFIFGMVSNLLCSQDCFSNHLFP